MEEALDLSFDRLLLLLLLLMMMMMSKGKNKHTTLNVYCSFHGCYGYDNPPQCYVLRTLPALS